MPTKVPPLINLADLSDGYVFDAQTREIITEIFNTSKDLNLLQKGKPLPVPADHPAHGLPCPCDIFKDVDGGIVALIDSAKLGEGSFGPVYVAQALQSGENGQGVKSGEFYAVKVQFSEDRQAIRDIANENKIGKKQNIGVSELLTKYDDEKVYYSVMELIPGKSLAKTWEGYAGYEPPRTGPSMESSSLESLDDDDEDYDSDEDEDEEEESVLGALLKIAKNEQEAKKAAANAAAQKSPAVKQPEPNTGKPEGKKEVIPDNSDSTVVYRNIDSTVVYRNADDSDSTVKHVSPDDNDGTVKHVSPDDSYSTVKHVTPDDSDSTVKHITPDDSYSTVKHVTPDDSDGTVKHVTPDDSYSTVKHVTPDDSDGTVKHISPDDSYSTVKHVTPDDSYSTVVYRNTDDNDGTVKHVTPDDNDGTVKHITPDESDGTVKHITPDDSYSTVKHVASDESDSTVKHAVQPEKKAANEKSAETAPPAEPAGKKRNLREQAKANLEKQKEFYDAEKSFHQTPLEEKINTDYLSQVDVMSWLELYSKMNDAVSNMHQNGILHFDIKPENMMYEKESGKLTIIDYGTSIDVSTREKLPPIARHFRGTAAYMAPEMISSSSDQVSTKQDIYSMGRAMELLAFNHLYQLTDKQGAAFIEFSPVAAAPKMFVSQFLKAFKFQNETGDPKITALNQTMELIRDIRNFAPNSRPSSEEIKSRLDSIANNYRHAMEIRQPAADKAASPAISMPQVMQNDLKEALKNVPFKEMNLAAAQNIQLKEINAVLAQHNQTQLENWRKQNPQERGPRPSELKVNSYAELKNVFAAIKADKVNTSAPTAKATTSESKVATPEPQAAAPEPKAVAPEPKAVAPEPKAVAPEPKAVAPEPKAAAPEPKAAAPEPKAAAPEPKAAAPEPKAAAPDPAGHKAPPPVPPRSSAKSTQEAKPLLNSFSLRRNTAPTLKSVPQEAPQITVTQVPINGQTQPDPLKDSALQRIVSFRNQLDDLRIGAQKSAQKQDNSKFRTLLTHFGKVDQHDKYQLAGNMVSELDSYIRNAARNPAISAQQIDQKILELCQKGVPANKEAHQRKFSSYEESRLHNLLTKTQTDVQQRPSVPDVTTKNSNK